MDEKNVGVVGDPSAVGDFNVGGLIAIGPALGFDANFSRTDSFLIPFEVDNLSIFGGSGLGASGEIGISKSLINTSIPFNEL